MADRIHGEVIFELEEVAGVSPPVRWERLWAYRVGPGLYNIDNIPIFVKGISTGDVVSVRQVGHELHFKALIRPSANSVFRLYFYNESDVKATRETFRMLGCEWAQSHFPTVIAVEIPNTVPIEPLVALIREGAESGYWEYEQASLRHPVAV